MKSERRHDLQHNTLDAELAKGIDFLRKYANKILTGILVIAVIYAGWVYLDRRATANQAEVQSAFSQLKTQGMMLKPNYEELIRGYKTLSEQDAVEWVAADSLVELGVIYAKQSLEADKPEERDRAVEQSTKYFERVLAEYGDQPVRVAGARMGLGKLAEGKGDFAKAREMYKAVSDDKALAGYPVATQALMAEASLMNLSEKVVLAAALPAWAPQEATVPADITAPSLPGDATPAEVK